MSVCRYFSCWCKLLVVAAALMLLVPQAKADFFKFSGKRKKENIPFKLVKNLMVIPVMINGNGPYNFILDTGVGLFLITDPTLIDSIDIKYKRSIKILGFGDGEDMSAYVTPSVAVKIGSAVADNMPAAILKKDLFELSAFAGMPIHGLIGYEFFNSFTVRINYLMNIVTIYRSESSYIPRKGIRIPITIEERKPYTTIEVQLDNGENFLAKLIIDTGAGHPVSLETNAGLPFELPAVNVSANLGVGLSGPIKGYLGRIKAIKLGKHTLTNVIAAFPDYEQVAAKITSISRNGNMGNGILKRFEVVFDYKRGYMYLRPSPVMREPFEHDMSGMELTSAGDGYNRIIISRIEPGSAAEIAGLKKDDEILTINFKPVKEMTMQEIDNMFRSKDDRSFILDIMPDGSKERDRVILTLHRRI